MALINLELLRILFNEAQLNRNAAIRQSFNVPADPDNDSAPAKISDNLYVHLVKTHAQAKVIYKNLKRIHKVSTDFAAGNFQPYVDKQNRFEEKNNVPADERGFYDPFCELDIPFNHAFNYPLPRRIEQFKELFDLSQQFTKVRALKRDGLNPFFGNEPLWYEYTNEDGQTDVFPPSDLPEDFVQKQIIADELRSIEVEYCLDGYNEFYFLARDYTANYQEEKNLSQLAAKILALYK
ncbi:hypothetical protein [Spirosoma aerophilum]